jgi:hypothetical protein
MMCPKCGEKWGVTNTVPSGAGLDRANLLNRGSQLASWYCEDFVVRIRRCRSCNYRNTTIELIISDVYKMFKIVGDEGIDIIEYSEIGGRNEAKKPSKS